MRYSRVGFVLILLWAFTLASDLRAACACASTLGANNRKAGNTFWTAGNCLAGEHISSCNSIAGDDDCTLSCAGCAYQATDGAGQETGCFTDAGCATTPCTGVSEISSPLEIWKSVKRVWQVYVRKS